MWGEDIAFFSLARTLGWTSLVVPLSGYLSVVQFLTAMVAEAFRVDWTAAIYCYVSIGLTLLVVWLVTSPRLDLPFRPVLALAIVIVPMGFEELGTITNIHWILPIGGLALVFMCPPKPVGIIAAEAAFLALMALSGPFSIFMTPMFLYRSLKTTGLERKRLVTLGLIVAVGALVQVWIIGSLLHVDLGIKPTDYPWSLWITLPVRQILSVYPPISNCVDGLFGVAVGLLVSLLAGVACFTGPYRDQKRAMLFLSTCIAIGGMLKFRAALDTQITATRYFYIGNVFVLWTLCCLSRRVMLGRGLALFVVATEVVLLPVVAATPRSDIDFQWPAWARAVDRGLPFIIPTAPEGFYWVVPAASEGRLPGLADWRGRSLLSIDPKIDADLCSGSLDDLDERPKIHVEPYRATPAAKLWEADGTLNAVASARSFPFVTLVGDDDRVIGFGVTGFQSREQGSTGDASGWRAVFAAGHQRTLRAYAVTYDGTACPLANTLSFPAEVEPMGSETLVEAVELVAGRHVSQRFVPTSRFRKISATLVTWGKMPSRYPVDWQVRAHRGRETLVLGSGQFDAGSVKDWQSIDLPIAPPPGPPLDDVDVSFSVRDELVVRLPVGIPLVRTANDDAAIAEIDGQATGSGGHAKLTVTSDR